MAHDRGLEGILDDPERNLPLLRLLKSSGVASLALLLAEIVDGLADEIVYVWPSRLSVMKIIYIVNRYSTLIDATLEVTTMLLTTNPKSCSIQYQITSYVYAAGAFFSEFILMGRTLALYNFDRRILALMVVISLSIVISSLVTGSRLLESIQYPGEAILKIIGCVPSIVNRPTSSRQTSRSILVNTMFRDGTLYYFVMLSVSVCNLCFMLLAPEAISSIMQPPLRVVHSTLCARVLLNLRKVAARLSDPTFDEFTPRSGLTFDQYASYDIPRVASPDDVVTRPGNGRVQGGIVAQIELELGPLEGHAGGRRRGECIEQRVT